MATDRVMGEAIDRIARQVAADYGVTVEALRGRSRKSKIVRARQDLMWRARYQPSVSGAVRSHLRIGRYLGRHHTTIMDGIRRHEGRLGGS